MEKSEKNIQNASKFKKSGPSGKKRCLAPQAPTVSRFWQLSPREPRAPESKEKCVENKPRAIESKEKCVKNRPGPTESKKNA